MSLDENIVLLDSKRITDRKKACDYFMQNLNDPDIIERLEDSWKNLFTGVQNCLLKDADKIIDDMKKKGTSQDVVKITNVASDIFLSVLRFGLRERNKLNVYEVTSYIVNCLRNEKMKKCYERTFLLALKDTILSHEKNRSELDASDWQLVFDSIKTLCKDKKGTIDIQSLYIKCMMLIIKYGPDCSFPATVLRNELPFIITLVQSINKNHHKGIQEDIVDILTDFCLHTAKDKRSSCCELGECTFPNVVEFYELNGSEHRLKVKLIDYFLLQVKIHHPNGEKEDNTLAVNWNIWKKYMYKMYVILMKEMDFYVANTYKNASIFKTTVQPTKILDTFKILFAELTQQLLGATDLNLTLTSSSQIPSAKRQKLELGIHNMISNIEILKDWPWIDLLTTTLKMYPKLLIEDNFLYLLQVLTNIIVDSQDLNLKYHAYECLIVLEQFESQMHFEHNEAVQTFWRKIAKFAVLSTNLIENTHILINNLTIRKDILDSEMVLKNYLQSPTTSVNAIKTIYTLLSTVKFRRIGTERQESIARWLLNLETKFLSQKESAAIFGCMCFKQWPKTTPIQLPQTNLNIYSEVVSLYNNINLDNLEEQSPINKTELEDVSVDSVILSKLLDILQEENYNKSDTKEVLHITEFILNLLDFMMSYGVITEESLANSVLFNLMQSNMEKMEEISKMEIHVLTKTITHYLPVLHRMFLPRDNKLLNTALRGTVTQATLGAIVNVLQYIYKKIAMGQTSQQLLDTKTSIIKCLLTYGFISGTNVLYQDQINILEMLVDFEYTYTDEEDVKIVLLILDHLKYTKSDVSLKPHIVKNILLNFGEIGEEYYKIYDYAVKILQCLKHLIKHFGNLNHSYQEKVIAVLIPFYSSIDNYGPKVALEILGCIEVLYQVNPSEDFCTEGGKELIQIALLLLSSPYVEIRLKAINTLMEFFKVTSQSCEIKYMHRQEIIFHEILEQSRKFLAEENLSEDDLSIRNSTVLLTFSKLMLSCSFWIEESFLGLLKLVHETKLKSVKSTIEKVARLISGGKLENAFLESHLKGILEKWIDQGYNIVNFPFSVFNCANKTEFYTKYLEICVPLIINNDKNGLLEAANSLGLTEKKLIERALPKIFTKIVHEEVENLRVDRVKFNTTMVQLFEILGNDCLINLLRNNLDKVILNLVSLVSDEKCILEHFKERVIFYNKYLSYNQFLTSLQFLKEFLQMEDVCVLLTTRSDILERLMLSLKLNIYNSVTLQSRLKALHHYILILKLVIPKLHKKINCMNYFIRDCTYSFVNLIKNHNLLCGKFTQVLLLSFLNFLKQILPQFSDSFQQFFVFVVNFLENLILTNESIKQPSLEILKFLILENQQVFSDNIIKLDEFTHIAEFTKINSIISKIKYEGKTYSFAEEIGLFLTNNEDCSTFREETLKHLRQVLSLQKDELMAMYEQLKENRGFSEDCEKSLLHRLVATLTKISRSSDKNVSMEAVKCLGELGPANLLTLILQPEKVDENLKCAPFELICGKIVMLLSKYIVDSDIEVVKVASIVLYSVMVSKESRKMAGSSFNFGQGIINDNFLVPFMPLEKSTASTNVGITNDLFISTMNSNDIWCPTMVTHDEWIVKLVTMILRTFNDKSFMSKLIPICEKKVELCEELLPLIIHLLLHVQNEEVINIMRTKINYFFEQHWKFSQNKLSNNVIVSDKRTVKCMLSVVDFVRLQKAYTNTKKLHDLNLCYLNVAQASQYCDDHFAAIFYAELGCYNTLEELEKQNCKTLPAGYTKYDVIYDSLDQETSKAMHNIYRTAYKTIGDLDAIAGCGISFILEPEFRVEQYKDTNQWDQVAHFYEMQVGRDPFNNKSKLMDSLKMCSLYEVPLLCTSNLETPQYECMWRLGRWNLEETISDSNAEVTKLDFNKFQYYTLKSMHDNDTYNFSKASKMETLSLLENLKHINLKCCKNFYPILTEIQCLVESLDFFEATENNTIQELLHKWKKQDLITASTNFEYLEPIISQRIVMLKNYLKNRKSNADLQSSLIEIMLNFADLARNENKYRVASRVISDLQQIPNIESTVKAKIELSQAQLCWALNDTSSAKHILNKLGRNTNENPNIRSKALKLSGQYLVETYSENRHTILNDYFIESLRIIESAELVMEEAMSVVDTFDKLASFADREYQQIVNHMKSDLFQKKLTNMKKSKETALLIRNKRGATDDERRAATIHEKQSRIDELEIENTKRERDGFLQLAIKFYLRSLQLSDKNNIRIFRMMSLFLENRNNTTIKPALDDNMHKIQTYKYIDMLPQLVPHLSDANDLFTTEVTTIVQKCALDHPHHTIPLILALVNANNDREFTKSKTTTSSNDARVLAATKLLAKVKKTSKSDLITKMNAVAVALIELAYHDMGEVRSKKKEFTIPSSLKIMKIKNYDDVLLPTVTIPVSKSNTYKNIVGISCFKNTFSAVGGINAPKRIKCRGTDGKERSQLVKGRDDLRQDSVMQQVFNIMNNLLSGNKQTSDLIIRTYKIVPLSMRSGILEWVDNSMPIGEYLVGENCNSGAHSLYRPKDMSPAECRNQYKKTVGETSEVKLKIFNVICGRCKPVFHKFFEEMFLQPTIWYERRRAYINSIATTSMCGYILGIGDRHVSNILIDKNTAEVIHIDFGIAFEQGRCLPTPETVPFRLTRDIIDGMGVSGVEGMFKRSCEKTMEVLRSNAQTIVTILEVLLYDPLYSWSVTPAEANKRQTDEDASVCNDLSDEDNVELNITAERALLRLRSKLQGTEEGNQTSIEHQVGTLIQQAMDPSNLCRLFHGWQPYL